MTAKRRGVPALDEKRRVLAHHHKVDAQRHQVKLVLGFVFQLATVPAKVDLHHTCKCGMPRYAFFGHGTPFLDMAHTITGMAAVETGTI